MIRRELGIFLVVGMLTVLVDFCSYRGLLWLHVASVDVAKASGFLIGTVFAYFANKAWTFGSRQHAPGSFVRFAVLYALTLGANVLVNKAVLAALGSQTGYVQIAFLCATAVSAALNFLGMKFFVFRRTTNTEVA